MTDLPGHDGKVTSDKRMMIFISHLRNKGSNRHYCSHFSMIFEITSKFPIVILRLVFGKVWVDGVTGPERVSEIRYESDLQIVLKGLGFLQ